MKVRTNADNPPDARNAVEFGAMGIGLLRAEHMFLNPKDRACPIVQRDAALRDGREAPRSEADALRKEIENGVRREDGSSSRRASTTSLGRIEGPMGALPRRHRAHPADAAGRLRGDLPRDGGQARDDPADGPADARVPAGPRRAARRRDAAAGRRRRTRRSCARRKRCSRASNALREQNPMLGLRGCRLGILYPEISEMQVKAIFRAAVKLATEGVEVLPEIMIPLVGVRDGAAAPARAARGDGAQRDGAGRHAGGVPVRHDDRAAARGAARPARSRRTAEFFSFGTNDLTQTTLGFSRDDAEGKFLGKYLEMGHPQGQPVRDDRPGRRRRD